MRSESNKEIFILFINTVIANLAASLKYDYGGAFIVRYLSNVAIHIDFTKNQLLRRFGGIT